MLTSINSITRTTHFAFTSDGLKLRFCLHFTAERLFLAWYNGAFIAQLRCSLLSASLLPRLETVVLLLVCGRWSQESEEVTTMCATSAGTSCSATAAVPVIPGTMFSATPLAALRLLLLLWRPCQTRYFLVGLCRDVVLSVEQGTRILGK